MKKFITYICKKNTSVFSTSIDVNGKPKFITFSTIGHGTLYTSGSPQYETANEDIQKAIEASKYFKEGLIEIKTSVPAGEENEVNTTKTSVTTTTKSVEPTSFPDVKTFDEAKKVLQAEPYKVHHSKLASVEKIVAEAAALGVTFPNLPVE